MNIRFKIVFFSVVAMVAVPIGSVPELSFEALRAYQPTKSQLKKVGKVAGGVVGAAAALYVAAQLACGNSLSEIGSFLIEGLKHPTEIGTFSPCSKYLGKALCAKMPRATKTGHRYLEAGAGTGIVSVQIIEKMAQNDHLVLSEFVPELAQILRVKFAKEIAAGRVSVVEGDVCAYQSSQKFDYIFTTIPFNAFDVDMTKGIWGYFLKNLNSGGGISYVNYRFFPELRLKFQSSKKVQKLKGVMDFLDALHEKHGNGFYNVHRNVPPIRVRYFKFASPTRVNLNSFVLKNTQQIAGEISPVELAIAS